MAKGVAVAAYVICREQFHNFFKGKHFIVLFLRFDNCLFHVFCKLNFTISAEFIVK